MPGKVITEVGYDGEPVRAPFTTRSGDAYTVLSKRAGLSEGGVVLLYAYDIGRNQEELEDTGVKS